MVLESQLEPVPTFSGRDGAHHHRRGDASESASRIKSPAPLEAEVVRELGAPEDSAWRRARRAGLGTDTGSGPPGALHSARAAQASPPPRSAHRRDLLTDELVDAPPVATRSGWPELDCRELLLRGEVGDLNINLPCPQLTRHLREGRNGSLGKVSIPLRPSGLLAIG